MRGSKVTGHMFRRRQGYGGQAKVKCSSKGFTQHQFPKVQFSNAKKCRLANILKLALGLPSLSSWWSFR